MWGDACLVGRAEKKSNGAVVVLTSLLFSVALEEKSCHVLVVARLEDDEGIYRTTKKSMHGQAKSPDDRRLPAVFY